MSSKRCPVLVVSKMLGHSKTSTTLDIYGHLIPGLPEKAAHIMDEIITSIPVDIGKSLEAKHPEEDQIREQLLVKKKKACIFAGLN